MICFCCDLPPPVQVAVKPLACKHSGTLFRFVHNFVLSELAPVMRTLLAVPPVIGSSPVLSDLHHSGW